MPSQQTHGDIAKALDHVSQIWDLQTHALHRSDEIHDEPLLLLTSSLTHPRRLVRKTHPGATNGPSLAQ